ncbi:MAG: hypothetical protein Q8916_10685 [Bacteroidota bacterium]|nr:hypothetical protein [Bacteroidota bacterium]MDP4230855.1 hypothetical protein [Bacteroidota bacterium]MDP4237326.1 hypothetical protein [Bacteroidota bacterium]
MSRYKYILSAFLCLACTAGNAQWSTFSYTHFGRIDHFSSCSGIGMQYADGLDTDNSHAHRRNGITAQLIMQATSDTECCYLADRGKGWWSTGIAANDKKCNDTLRLFIERCGSNHIIPCFGYPGEAFSYISDAVSGMDTANGRWLDYREWLKKVLYINSDTNYYCDDVIAMFSTFNYLTPGRGEDNNGLIAIMDYLIKNDRCPAETKSLLQMRAGTRNFEVQHWRDTVVDSNATPIDTSAVSIDEIGFSILRGESGVVGIHKLPRGLSALVATKNPFEDQTTLELTIGDAMMLRLEIIDVLGRELYSENRFFFAGDIRWVLEGKDFPEGSFYARISTIGGEVRTIKLVHK